MVKRWTALVFAGLLLVWLSVPVLAQDTEKKDDSTGMAQDKGDMSKGDMSKGEMGEKKGKQDRWEGVVSRSNKDKSTFTVRQRSSNAEKTVKYDSSTKFVEAEHHAKPKEIDADQIKDGDRIIALGKWEKGGAVLDASMISKRLTQH